MGVRIHVNVGVSTKVPNELAGGVYVPSVTCLKDVDCARVHVPAGCRPCMD